MTYYLDPDESYIHTYIHTSRSKLNLTMAPNDNFISKAVQDGVASAGSMAGGVVDSAGKSVTGAGQGVGKRSVRIAPLSPRTSANQFSSLNSITNATAGAGNSVSDYGNGIKDWTKADGARTQTAKNPLGTTSNSYGGKGVVTGKGKSGGKGTAGNALGLSL